MAQTACRAVLLIDAILCIAALVAAKSPIGSTRRAIGAGIFTAGAVIGALEGAAGLFSSTKKS